MRNGRRNLFALLLAVVISTPSLSAQGRTRANTPSKPAPRFQDGTPNLGITAQERGLWLPLDRTELGRRSTLAPAPGLMMKDGQPLHLDLPYIP
jgi:hypothetical protein